MVGRGNEDGVHVLVVEHLPQVLDGSDGLAGLGLDDLGCRPQPIGVHLADVGHTHVLPGDQIAQVLRAHAARADQPHVHPLVRAGGAQSRGTRLPGRSRGRTQPSLCQKRTTIVTGHRTLLE